MKTESESEKILQVKLALDLGSKCGWAVDMNGQIFSGVQDFTPRRFDGGGMRFLRFSRWLDELFNGEPPGSKWEVCFEEVRRHLSTDSAHVYGGLMATLTSWCELKQIPYQGVPVQTIKKTVTGKGNASKDVVLEAVRQMGYKPKDDNEADALALLTWRLAQ